MRESTHVKRKAGGTAPGLRRPLGGVGRRQRKALAFEGAKQPSCSAPTVRLWEAEAAGPGRSQPSTGSTPHIVHGSPHREGG